MRGYFLMSHRKNAGTPIVGACAEQSDTMASQYRRYSTPSTTRLARMAAAAAARASESPPLSPTLSDCVLPLDRPVNVLITGGSSGVGAATAQLAASKGANLFLVGRRAEGLLSTAELCASLGASRVETAVADVSSEADVERVCDSFESEFGPMDVAVLNAGIGRPGLLEEVSPADFDQVFAVNVRGVYLYLRRIIPTMKRAGRGQVVVTSSVMAERTAARSSIYTASKHAVHGMLGCLRKELVEFPLVKVGSVMPGGIDTPWWTDAGRGGKRDVVPDTSKFLSPEAVAAAIWMLVEQHRSSNIDRIVLDPAGM